MMMEALEFVMSVEFWRMAVLWTFCLLLSYWKLIASNSCPSKPPPSPSAFGHRPLCIITGATSGLGAAAAHALSAHGFFVVLVGRSSHLLAKTMMDIKTQNKNAHLKAFQVDLASFDSILQFKASLQKWLSDSEMHSSIQLLINNAGILATSSRLTCQGYDQMMATNYLGAFSLTKLLLPLLRNSPIPSRIVNVTSFTHRSVLNVQVDKDIVSGKCFGRSKRYPYAHVYEYSKPGKLPKDNNVSWRGDSCLTDGNSNTKTLVGGYYDAGDASKLSFPASFAMTMLSWSVIEYSAKYEALGELDHVKGIIKWGTDYLLNTFNSSAHSIANVVADVRGGDHDANSHDCWIRPEDIDHQRTGQECYNCPALAAEMASALASASIVFKDNIKYSQKLVHGADLLFKFATKQQGAKYADGADPSSPLYNSTGFWDEFLWWGSWLYLATGNLSYLQLVTNPDLVGHERALWTDSDNRVLSWDNKHAGAFLKVLVDSDTLPLNVSQEMLQQHSILKTIKKKIIRKALDMICKLAEEDPDESNDKDKKAQLRHPIIKELQESAVKNAEPS